MKWVTRERVNDHEVLEKQFIVYDALYEYCRQRLAPVE